MAQCLKRGHAETDINHRRRGGENEIDKKKSFCRFLDSRQRPGRRRTRAFQIHHAGTSFPELRKKRRKNHDDTQSAEPVGEGTEKEQTFRNNPQIGENGRPRSGHSGNTFHQSVQRGEQSAEYIGKNIKKRNGKPGQRNDGDAFPGIQIFYGRNSFFISDECQ